MGIADTDNRVLADSTDPKLNKARSRMCRKRRPLQSSILSNWTFCSDLQRQWSRRRIRRLYAADRNASTLTSTSSTRAQRSHLKQQSWAFFYYTLLPMLIVLCFSCCITIYQNPEEVSKFWQRYINQYQAIVHNKRNYCGRNIPLRDIFEYVESNVINQELALKQLELALSTRSSFQSIAVVGTSGLGKSLTMRLLHEVYPWAENVQSLAWNDYDLLDEEARYKTILAILRNLAHCGRNLIIIDNMAVGDIDYVAMINNLVQTSSDIATGNNDLDKKQLTIIYVFNLNGMLTENHFIRQMRAMNSLHSGTTVINYRNFDETDLERCVRHEAHLVGLTLDERYVDDIVNNTNVNASGCKTVRSKVLIYGRPMATNEEGDAKIEQATEDAN